jgi:hypothetical protein
MDSTEEEITKKKDFSIPTLPAAKKDFVAPKPIVRTENSSSEVSRAPTAKEASFGLSHLEAKVWDFYFDSC